jgi:hypothetical protein
LQNRQQLVSAAGTEGAIVLYGRAASCFNIVWLLLRNARRSWNQPSSHRSNAIDDRQIGFHFAGAMSHYWKSANVLTTLA